MLNSGRLVSNSIVKIVKCKVGLANKGVILVNAIRIIHSLLYKFQIVLKFSNHSNAKARFLKQ